MVKHSSLFFQVALLWTIAAPSRDAHPKEPLLLQPHEPVQTTPSASKNRPTDGNLPPSLVGTNSFVWQPGATSCAANLPRLLQAPPFYGQLGHGTATNMVKHSSLFFQVALLWTIAAPSRDAHPKEPLLLQPHEPVQTPPSASKNRPTDGNLPPSLAGTNSFVWQPGATSCAANPPRLLQAPPFYGQLGHGTATYMVKHSSLFFQVSYTANATCVRTNDPFLLAVSCPIELRNCVRKYMYHLLCSLCQSYFDLSFLLIMSGDVELNPGPANSDTSTSLEQISQTLSRLESTQCTILSEIALIRAAQNNIESLVNGLSSRVDTLEKTVEKIQAAEPNTSLSSHGDVAKLTSEIRTLTEKCEDAESRLRRSNLLFFGIQDSNNETWAQSETHIVTFLSEKLNIAITADDIERAHRLGRFQASKNRPIIVKFLRFKDKSKILAASSELKDTSFSIREDLSARVRLARKKLYLYAFQYESKFKIRYDKLVMNNKQFIYKAESDSVVELS
ncbi:uncharacterized protein LOC144115957 [Amblyomma americanum]